MSQFVNIDLLRQTYDSARTYKWDLVIVSSGGLTDTLPDKINLRCESADQPAPSEAMMDVNIRGFTRKESGAVSWNPINLVVVETVNYSMLESFTNVHNLQFNYRTGVQQPKSIIETSINLNLLSLGDNVVGTWQIIGGLVEAFPPPQLNNDKGGYWTGMGLTLHYDYAIYTRVGTPEPIA